MNSKILIDCIIIDMVTQFTEHRWMNMPSSCDYFDDVLQNVSNLSSLRARLGTSLEVLRKCVVPIWTLISVASEIKFEYEKYHNSFHDKVCMQYNCSIFLLLDKSLRSNRKFSIDS